MKGGFGKLRLRTVLVWLLTALGMWLWAPQLYDALRQPSEGRQTTLQPPASPNLRLERNEKSNDEPLELKSPEVFAELPARGQSARVIDPLVRSIEMTALPPDVSPTAGRRPVQAVVLAERLLDAEPETLEWPAPSGVPSPTGLVLDGTLIGVERRAASINNRLCFEGSSIEHQGETYRVRSVHPQRVVLEKDGVLFELPTGPARPRDDRDRNP